MSKLLQALPNVEGRGVCCVGKQLVTLDAVKGTRSRTPTPLTSKKKNTCEVKAIEECGEKPATTYKYQNSPPAPPNLHPNALQLGATSARTVGQASIQMPI